MTIFNICRLNAQNFKIIASLAMKVMEKDEVLKTSESQHLAQEKRILAFFHQHSLHRQLRVPLPDEVGAVPASSSHSTIQNRTRCEDYQRGNRMRKYMSNEINSGMNWNFSFSDFISARGSRVFWVSVGGPRGETSLDISVSQIRKSGPCQDFFSKVCCYLGLHNGLLHQTK